MEQVWHRSSFYLNNLCNAIVASMSGHPQIIMYDVHMYIEVQQISIAFEYSVSRNGFVWAIIIGCIVESMIEPNHTLPANRKKHSNARNSVYSYHSNATEIHCIHVSVYLSHPPFPPPNLAVELALILCMHASIETTRCKHACKVLTYSGILGERRLARHSKPLVL